METRAHYILVGLFTLGAGAALLAFALWITGAGADREIDYYQVLFREPVSGLSVGSPVQYSGIRVGAVERLDLDPVDPRIVRARIWVEADTPIKVDTEARQTLLNVTGASSIELSQGLPESPRLTADNGEMPVIEATASSLAQLRLTSEQLLLDMSTLLERANSLLSEENAQRISSVLDNVEAVTGALADQQNNVRSGISDLADGARAMNELMQRVNATLDRYEEPMLGGASDAIAELRTTSEQLKQMLQESEPALRAGAQSFAELGPAMRELRSILNNVDAITRRISDDPANFVLGSDNIREYQP